MQGSKIININAIYINTNLKKHDYLNTKVPTMQENFKQASPDLDIIVIL